MNKPRKFQKSLVGDFVFDIERDRHRDPVFLSRNMRRVAKLYAINAHVSHEQGSQKDRFTNGTVIGSAAAGVGSNGHLVYRHGESSRSQTKRPNSAAISHKYLSTATAQIDPDFMNKQPPDHLTARPLSEQVPSKSTSVNPQSLKDGSARRSLRRTGDGLGQNPQSTLLVISLRSIRKKLNFKTNKLSTSQGLSDGDVRPRKRQRPSAGIDCQCHVTIWDNRTSNIVSRPLVVESQKCVVTSRNVPNGKTSEEVKIEMQAPICIKADQLQVNVSPPGRPPLFAVAENYFMEIKIVPETSHTDMIGATWPPFAILSSSEADLFRPSAQGCGASEALYGSLLAKYMHLPRAPDAAVPLSIFYLYDEKCYRTKYGLEIQANWMKSDEANLVIKAEVDNSNVKSLKELFPDERSDQAHLGTVGDGDSSDAGTLDSATPLIQRSSLRASKSNSLVPKTSAVEVSYLFEPKSTIASKESRVATLAGLRCPACRIGSFDTLNELRFHLTHSHHKYRFDLEEEKRDPVNKELRKVAFTVSAPTMTARPKEIRDLFSELEWNWEKPKQEFDIAAFLNGDSKWLGNLAPQERRRTVKVPLAPQISSDPLTALRQQNGGFLLVDQVPQQLPDFNTARKRHGVVKTRTANALPSYDSVGHWKLGPAADGATGNDDDDLMSESDDDTQLLPGNWLREKHLANLRDLSEPDLGEGRPLGLSAAKVEFMVKWDGFRMAEGLSHPKFVADSLVRFARMEKAWLRGPGWKEFTEFLGVLKERRAIDDKVIGGVWRIVFRAGEDG